MLGRVIGWDGPELPPTARQRLARAEASRTRSSLLSVPAAAGIESVGFAPVAEVMGCVVIQIGWRGYTGCAQWSPYGGWTAAGRTVAASASGRATLGPYVRAVTHGYETALHRMVLETQTLGGDGVVGVRLEVRVLEADTTEFVARGTAVRARSQTHPLAPFTTDLPGTDVAKLLMSGWLPVRLIVAVDVGLRHNDYITRTQAQSPWLTTANMEVDGYTDLVHSARGFARDRFQAKAADLGAEGALLSGIGMQIWEAGCDHLAEVRITGTAITSLPRRQRAHSSGTLTMLPLRRRS